MDLKALSDADLADHLNTVLAEQERRAAVANTAAQIEGLTARFVAGGGDPTSITAAVTRGKNRKPDKA